MKAPEHTAPRRVSIALAIAAAFLALACGERKPDAATTTSSNSSNSSNSSTSSSSSGSRLALPAFSMAGASASDSTVLRLAAATDATPDGTPVHLSVAHAQSVMSDRGFWIGVWGQQVYVFQTSSRPAPVQGGEAYSVTGTVHAAPQSTQGAPRGMTPIDIEAMHAQHIYIAADSVAAGAR